MSASAQGEAGTSSAGLNTTQLPKASAGAIFHAGIASGKFQGVMAATTPTGSRVTSTSIPGRVGVELLAAGAKRLAGKELEDASGARGFADAVGQRLPFSRASRRPSSSFLARISVPARSRISKRSCGVVRDHLVNAVLAEAIARFDVGRRTRGEFADDVREVGGVDVRRAILGVDSLPSIKFG